MDQLRSRSPVGLVNSPATITPPVRIGAERPRQPLATSTSTATPASRPKVQIGQILAVPRPTPTPVRLLIPGRLALLAPLLLARQLALLPLLHLLHLVSTQSFEPLCLHTAGEGVHLLLGVGLLAVAFVLRVRVERGGLGELTISAALVQGGSANIPCRTSG